MNLVVLFLKRLAFSLSNFKFNINYNECRKYINNQYIKTDYNIENQVNEKEDYDLSILIPAYNSEKTIEKCLDSIFYQKTHYSYEVVIVNDGSVDNTLNLVKKYKSKFKNIKLISQENKGISYTRNVLLRNAKGKYISFLDSDDYYNGEFIEKMLKTITQKKVQYVKCNYQKLSQNGEKIFETAYHKNTSFDKLDKYLWGSIIEKKVYKGISFPNNYWFEDMINELVVLPKIKKYEIVDKVLYNYINYESSATKLQGKNKNIKNLDQFFLVLEIVRNFNKNNIQISEYQYFTILNELSTMLMIRTRKLNLKIKKSIFYLACELIKKLKIDEINNNDILQILKIFKSNNFLSWNLYSIARRLEMK